MCEKSESDCRVNDMRLCKALWIALVLASCTDARAQIAGRQPHSVTVAQSKALLRGWSVKKSVLGKPIYNDKNQKIGRVYDLIVAPDGSLSAVIVSTGGFLGVATHDVAVPIGSLSLRSSNLHLRGATKDVLMVTPEFEYTKVKSPPMPKNFEQ
jgi:hypothetical protein